MTLWGGVFEHEPADAVRKLNDSLPFDWRLYDVDISGSKAWAEALWQAEILHRDEYEAITAGLEQVRQEFFAGEFVPAPGDEDIHTAIERRLTEFIGPVAGKLHTGRSRNDQVAVDLRLWMTKELPLLIKYVRKLQKRLLRQAADHTHSVMPGFTHFQPAQPITAAHWLLSFAQMLDRDRVRLQQIAIDAGVNPLGSGALAGTPYPINRHQITETLGFTRTSANSLDAVSDRDYVSGFLYASALLMVHLSRLAEDLILFSNPQFGFATLDDRYSTGSSLMPQKRNPDPLELARGKSGRIIGHLTGFLTTLKGLPSGYNKDIQEDKEPLFDTYDTLILLLPVITALIDTMTLHPENMRNTLNEGMLATDLADYLVLKGIPFRQAHHTAGQIVKLAESKGVSLSQLSIEHYQQISPDFADDVYEVLDFDKAVARRNAFGGPAPDAVRVQIAQLAQRLREEDGNLGTMHK
ncbi:argininosuccinate lyase [Chloroflexota bacterium]